MANFRRVDAPGGGAWQVDGAFRHVAHWVREPARRRDDEFVIRLTVGPADPANYFERGNARILMRGAVEDEFVVDTGAQVTVVSNSLAQRLRLATSGKPEQMRLAGHSTGLFFCSEVGVNIGSNWFVVPCRVPVASSPTTRPENLLGMKGLLDRHLFCLAVDELHVFRRRLPPVDVAGDSAAGGSAGA